MTADPAAMGSAVTCACCGRRKAPVGRSVPPVMYLCDHECPGYACRPLPGSLWPGETRAEFGFACSTAYELDGLGEEYRP